MKRFFAFGCSYTYYSWPTWADLLGLDFEVYENWAIPGIGNRAIFERLVEAHAANQFSKDDLIIVQWSSHLRFDWHNQHSLKDRTSNWRTCGSIFSEINEDILDKKWQYLFFDEFAYVMHTLNFILSAQNFLENIGCTWYMTGIGDIRKLNSDIKTNAEYGESLGRDLKLIDEYKELAFYESPIWDMRSQHWLDPIQPFCTSESSDCFYTFNSRRTLTTIDLHPTARWHQRWLEHSLSDKLPFKMDTDSHRLIVNSIDELYEKVGKNKLRHDFDNQLQDGNFYRSEGMNWPNKYKGLY